MESTLSVFLPDGWCFLPCDHGLDFETSLLCENSINQSINQSEAKLISLYNRLISATTKSWSWGPRTRQFHPEEGDSLYQRSYNIICMVFRVLGSRCLTGSALLDCHVLKGFGIYMIGILDS